MLNSNWAVSLLCDFIKCRSDIEAPKSEILEIATNAVTELGLIPLKVDSEQGTGLIAYPKDRQNDHLLLCSAHLDVVPPGDEKNWDFNPWIGDVYENYIRGRGSVDMKGGAAAFLGAYQQLQKKSESSPPVLFAFSVDEEVGMESTKAMAHRLKDFKLNYCLIGEPTSLKVGIMEKGVLWYKIIAKGKTAHGSMPEKGHNAIFELLPFLNKIKTHEWKEGVVEDTRLTKLLTGNLGEIKGGVAPNVVPDRVEASFDIRYPPSIPLQAIEKKVQQLVDDIGAELITVTNLPGVETARDHSFVQLVCSSLEKVQKSVEFTHLTYATDMAIYSPLLKLPMVICGPGDPQLAHQANEALVVQEFHDAIDLYIQIYTTLESS